MLNPNLTVTFCCGRKHLMIVEAFSSDIALTPPVGMRHYLATGAG
jgi:hypothetical protein